MRREGGLLLRLFFGRVLGPDQCRALLTRARDEARSQLTAYQELLARLSTTEGDSPDWPFMRMTILAGIHAAQATADWAQQCLAELPRPSRRTR